MSEWPTLPKVRPVPAGRLARLAQLGGLAAGLAGGALAQGARQLARGERPVLGNPVLAPGNMLRLAERLSDMRGAAMKMGQLLSMDAGALLPPEMAEIMGRLRADATPMPRHQLEFVLDAEWGVGWRGRVASFEPRPLAAASIGQVHRARRHDGRYLAVKVQYPGVARSIDSDVDNVGLLLRMSGLLPRGLDVGPLLLEAKEQLRAEADYSLEAKHQMRFARLLDGDDRFRLPKVHDDLSTPRILAMSYEEGEPLDELPGASQDLRDLIGSRLLELSLRELFEWGWMQTDPNLANYRWDGARKQIVLLDFGATRQVPRDIADLYRQVLRAACSRDRGGAEKVIEAFGAFDEHTPVAVRAEVLDLFDLAARALLHDGPYDFAEGDLLATLRERGMALALDKTTWRVPPAEMVFVQRKLGGLYLLVARLKARVDVRVLVEPYL